MKIVTNLTLAILLATCGRPADNIGGVCKLDCTAPILAGPESEIRMLGGDEDINLNCTGIATGDVYSLVPIRFVIGREGPSFPEEGMDASTESPPSSNQAPLVPQPGIGFQAVVMSGSGGPPDFFGGSSLYRGIRTDPEFWCTDACGVGSFEIQPICLENSYQLRMLIHSGSAAKVVNINVNPD